MKDTETIFKVEDKEYKAVFNLNVMQEIQMEYESFAKWGELTDSENGEVDIRALVFGIKAMLNEGIDIDNENSENKKEFLTEKQVGRIITKLGLLEAASKVNEAVVTSVSDDTSKNE